MDYNQLKSILNIRLGDTDNFTFTSEEKDQVLNEAFHDGSVVTIVWNDDLTFTASTWEYPLPAGVDMVKDIYVALAPDKEPAKIDSSLWEVIDGNLHLKPPALDMLPPNATLYIKGHKKYTTTDTIAEVNVQEYILNVAELHCLNMVGVKKALRFLKNDTTMGEIVAMKHELERKVARYKQRLPRSYEVD